MMKTTTCALIALTLAGCDAPRYDVDETTPSPAAERKPADPEPAPPTTVDGIVRESRNIADGTDPDWSWVIVGGMPNPGLDALADMEFALVSDIFGREKIEMTAAGSRGYSINVNSNQARRARAILDGLVRLGRLEHLSVIRP